MSFLVESILPGSFCLHLPVTPIEPRDIDPETLDRLLTVSNLSPVGKQTYERVLENAKRYYSEPQYRQAVDEMIEEQSVCL